MRFFSAQPGEFSVPFHRQIASVHTHSFVVAAYLVCRKNACVEGQACIFCNNAVNTLTHAFFFLLIAIVNNRFHARTIETLAR